MYVISHDINVVSKVRQIRIALGNRFVSICTESISGSIDELDIEALKFDNVPEIAERRARYDQVVRNKPGCTIYASWPDHCFRECLNTMMARVLDGVMYQVWACR